MKSSNETGINLDGLDRLKVTGWKMIGGAYKRGRLIPGATVLFLDNGRALTYPESVAIGPALELAAAEGIDITEATERLDHWAKTGEGVTFNLTR